MNVVSVQAMAAETALSGRIRAKRRIRSRSCLHRGRVGVSNLWTSDWSEALNLKTQTLNLKP